MTFTQLRKRVSPASVAIDNGGCIEVVAPEGHSFNGEMHALVTDPQFHPELSRSAVYDLVYDDFTQQTILKCEEDCCCMEEPE